MGLLVIIYDRLVNYTGSVPMCIAGRMAVQEAI